MMDSACPVRLAPKDESTTPRCPPGVLSPSHVKDRLRLCSTRQSHHPSSDHLLSLREAAQASRRSLRHDRPVVAGRDRLLPPVHSEGPLRLRPLVPRRCAIIAATSGGIRRNKESDLTTITTGWPDCKLLIVISFFAASRAVMVPPSIRKDPDYWINLSFFSQTSL